MATSLYLSVYRRCFGHLHLHLLAPSPLVSASSRLSPSVCSVSVSSPRSQSVALISAEAVRSTVRPIICMSILQSVGPSVRRSVGPSVRQSVTPFLIKEIRNSLLYAVSASRYFFHDLFANFIGVNNNVELNNAFILRALQDLTLNLPCLPCF